MTKPRILPRNPYQTVSGPTSEMIGKSVLRLLRSGHDFPVYRNVHFSRGMVKKLIWIISHCNRVNGLAQLMKAHEEVATGSSSEMWEFWNAFQLPLITEKLHIKVQVFRG